MAAMTNSRPGVPAVRCFALCTMRQMRDLRPYSVPVTVNNPKQVNIAADGGQQLNVHKIKVNMKEASARSKKEPSSS